MTATTPARSIAEGPAAADWSAWTCRVRVAVVDPDALDEARATVVEHMAAVDAACSRFRDDAELASVERSAGRWAPVSPVLYDLLSVAVEAARATGGDVDPTVGGALAGLGYDRDLANIALDGPAVAIPAPGWRAVELDGDRRRVRIAPGVRLDLGATAKAWTADQAAAAVAHRTGSGCLVSLGGDIAVHGAPPTGGWRIRVEDETSHPDDPAVGPSTVVTLRRGGLATSSTRARRWQRHGVELHHLLDPRTGLPPVPAWRTVSAAARSCLAANIVTTTAIVRGHRVWPYLRAARVPVRLVTVDGEVLTVGGWPG
jgi:thiamine biosynthesis lipoprotein